MRWIVLACVMAGAWLLVTGEARAGTYDVYGCRTGAGTPLPADGWHPYAETAAAFRTSDGCHAGTGLYAAFDPLATIPSQQLVGWEFAAPADTAINGYTLYRTSVVTGSGGGISGRDSWLYHDAPLYTGGGQDNRFAQQA